MNEKKKYIYSKTEYRRMKERANKDKDKEDFKPKERKYRRDR